MASLPFWNAILLKICPNLGIWNIEIQSLGPDFGETYLGRQLTEGVFIKYA